MNAMAPMPTEIVLLGWSVVLLLVQLVLQATLSLMEFGQDYAIGSRDEPKQHRNLVYARVGRAFRNLLETFPVFAALALALAVTGKTGGLGALGAHLWFWSRVVYLPLYAFAVPLLRTIAWTVALVGIVLMLIALLG